MGEAVVRYFGVIFIIDVSRTDWRIRQRRPVGPRSGLGARRSGRCERGRKGDPVPPIPLNHDATPSLLLSTVNGPSTPLLLSPRTSSLPYTLSLGPSPLVL